MENAYIQAATKAFSSLPGIGKKTALRLVFHMLNQDPKHVKQFTTAIQELVDFIQYCERCGNFSESNLCSVCLNKARSNGQICVVEHVKDLYAIEATASFSGSYHVLGGLISPIDGIGPEQLAINKLIGRIKQEECTEVILALSTSIQGDTTAFYLSRKLASFDIKVTALARGVSFGGDLEYVDDITLGRSLLSRIPFSNQDES